MQIPFDPTEVFAEAATEAVKGLSQEALRNELTRAGFSAVFVSVSGDVALSIMGQVLGPILHAFLKLIDPTQRKLDTILREPLQTGVQLAKQAVSLTADNPLDARLKESLFAAALQSLEKAFSYAESGKIADECLKIRITQALLAKEMRSDSVRLYISDLDAASLKQLRAFEDKLRQYKAEESRVAREMSPGWRQLADECFAKTAGTIFRVTEDELSQFLVVRYVEDELRKREIRDQGVYEGMYYQIGRLVFVRLQSRIVKVRIEKLRAFDLFIHTGL
jgi:hypothetical protein